MTEMARHGVGVALTVAALLAAPVVVEGQWERSEEGWCERDRGDRDRACMVLTRSFDAVDELGVDGGMNGGITVEGWERDEVEVRAKVWANAGDEARAQELADEVRIDMRRGMLSADGPRTGRRESWGVTWEIRVPTGTDLDLETHNGGIGVSDVFGRVRFEALNGGVRLTEVAGDVQGRTTNGGLHIELAGDRWNGEGLDVQTVNGGVTLVVPEDFSARLETGTVNGGIDIDFPITVQGKLGRRLTTTLGEGGPLVRAVTTNGGVRIRRGGRTLR